jgi:hypothetical protein
MRYAIVLSLFLAGCTTQPVATTYWTTKAGVVTVHHVVGPVDHPETLTQKRLTNEEIAAYKLPKGTYFKVKSECSDSPVTGAKAEAKKVTTKDALSAKAEPKAKAKDAESGASNDRIAEKIDALRREVQTVAAENRRLQEQINAPKAEQQPVGQDRPQTAEQDPDVPRLSQ